MPAHNIYTRKMSTLRRKWRVQGKPKSQKPWTGFPRRIQRPRKPWPLKCHSVGILAAPLSNFFPSRYTKIYNLEETSKQPYFSFHNGTMNEKK